MTVSAAATKGNDGAIVNAAIAELNSQFGVTDPNSLANFQMYFLGPGIMDGVAYAWVPGTISVYGNGWQVHLFLGTTRLFLYRKHDLCHDFVRIVP